MLNSQINMRPNSREDSHAFTIDCERINCGAERRTTVMIRNVPNKYSQRALLDLIDEKLSKSYDFFYLPIDFRNKCNLGYAFLNFKSPSSIVHLVHEFAGKRWERFKSDKVCEVTFARIQGKMPLIQHFRSSKLMHKHEKYRPLVIGSDGQPDSLKPEEELYGQLGKPTTGYGRSDPGGIPLASSNSHGSHGAGPAHFQIPVGHQPEHQETYPTGSLGRNLNPEALGIQVHRNSIHSNATVSRESSVSLSGMSSMSGRSTLPEDVFHMPSPTPSQGSSNYRHSVASEGTPGGGDSSPAFGMHPPAVSREYPGPEQLEPLRVEYGGQEPKPLRIEYGGRDQPVFQEGVPVMLVRGKIEAELRRPSASPPPIGSGRMPQGHNPSQLIHSHSSSCLVPFVNEGQHGLGHQMMDEGSTCSPGTLTNSGFHVGNQGPEVTVQQWNKWGMPNQQRVVGKAALHQENTNFDCYRAMGDDVGSFCIDRNNILTGRDARTTVMIRNVPNKYSQRALLELIDVNHAGTYDFFYLPIDFRNKCNLGYAFLNFKSAHSIVRLVDEFSGKRWERFKSDKVCEVTFARIQGKNALVQHFRSSRLMHKHEKYRPLVLLDKDLTTLSHVDDGCDLPFRKEELPGISGRQHQGHPDALRIPNPFHEDTVIVAEQQHAKPRHPGTFGGVGFGIVSHGICCMESPGGSVGNVGGAFSQLSLHSNPAAVPTATGMGQMGQGGPFVPAV